MSKPSEISRDLETISDILSESNFIQDGSPLRAVRKQLERNPHYYSVNNLAFRVIDGEYIRGGIWEKDLTVRLSGEVNIKQGDFIYSSISNMAINIEYSTLMRSEKKECKGSWHMDYHVMPGNPPNFMHPDFHMHHGGKKISQIESYGDMVILDTPRVMHHPLDVILGIDFVISNFFPDSEWKQLRANKSYMSIVERSQINWWQEYYKILSDYWSCKGRNDPASKKLRGDAQKLNPHFV